MYFLKIISVESNKVYPVCKFGFQSFFIPKLRPNVTDVAIIKGTTK